MRLWWHLMSLLLFLAQSVMGDVVLARPLQTKAVTNDAVIAPLLGSPAISNYDSKTYKAHGQNWVAVQDARGVMFFGNSYGILEFDGQRWQMVASPSNMMVRAMTIAADQTIYYGSIGDFGYLSVSALGKLTATSLKDLIPAEERLFNDVWQVESTSQGVYFLTRTKVFRYFQGKVSVVHAKFASSQALVMNDHLFFIDSEKGFSVMDGERAVAIPSLASLINPKRIVMTQFGPHEILVGRLSGDFQILDLRPLWDEASKRYRIESSALASIKRLPTVIDHLIDETQLYLYKILALDQQNFAISTIKGGVFILNRDGKLVRVINKNAGLADNTVAGIFQDRSHNLWVQTNSGISYIELSSAQSSFGSRNGIEGIAISMTRYRDKLYVGTYQGIAVESPFLYSIRQSVPQFTPLKDAPSEVWAFREVDGDLMVASGRGLYKIENDSGVRIPGSQGNSYTLGTTPRWPHHLFVGMMGGVEVFRRENGNWKSLGRIEGVEENVRRITTDADGELWLSTEVQGVLRLHFQGSSPTQVGIHRLDLRNGLPDMSAGRLTFFDSDLYLCSRKGLLRAAVAEWSEIGRDKTKFVPEERFGARFSDGSVALTELHSDGKDGAFIQAEKAVYWLKPNAEGRYVEVSQVFTGLPPPDESLYVDGDKAVWIAGESLNRIDLKTSPQRLQRFRALIRKVAANTKEAIFEGTATTSTPLADKNSIVSESRQSEADSKRLSYQQNALMFEFAAPFFEKPGSLRFQFYLEGFDQKWSEWDTITSKEYTNIPEGTYHFKVRAKNVYGVISDEAEYTFTILPPWYRTSWAYVLWICCASLSMALLVLLYTRRLRNNERKLEQEVRARTKEVVEQREAAERARHDITLLSEMGRKLTATLDPQAIQQGLFTYVQELISCNTFGVGMVDWERRLIRFDYVIENDKKVESYARSLDAKEQPAAQCVLFASELLINSLSIDTREFDSVLRLGKDADTILHKDVRDFAMPRSAMYVPMMLQEKVIGVISVQSHFPNAFHENDLVILRSLGAFAAVAFDNADSYLRLQQTQSKLVEQEKLAALGSVVAGVAHELNTPIGNSLLTASSLHEITDVFVDEINTGTIRRSRLDAYAGKAKTACDLLIRNLSNAADLITSFKQIAVDQTSDQRRQFHLNTMVSEIMFTLSNRLRREEHEVSIDVADSILMDSYPGPLGQVLTNLVMNSILHGFEGQRGGKIVLRGRQVDEHMVHLQMMDNGKGIAEEHLGRIFEPFFTTKMGQGGSGLGLHITYNIVTGVLGGSIKVSSTIGKGTCIDLMLPMIAPQTPEL